MKGSGGRHGKMIGDRPPSKSKRHVHPEGGLSSPTQRHPDFFGFRREQPLKHVGILQNIQNQIRIPTLCRVKCRESTLLKLLAGGFQFGSQFFGHVTQPQVNDRHTVFLRIRGRFVEIPRNLFQRVLHALVV